MKLSDAVATGRVLIMPFPGAEWHRDGSGCARGMALEGAGVGRIEEVGNNKNWQRFISFWPWTVEPATSHPCGCDFHSGETFCHHIAHIFDYHVYGKGDWTLDRLIDWVRSVEPADLPKPAPAPPAEQDIEALQTVPGPISI